MLKRMSCWPRCFAAALLDASLLGLLLPRSSARRHATFFCRCSGRIARHPTNEIAFGVDSACLGKVRSVGLKQLLLTASLEQSRRQYLREVFQAMLQSRQLNRSQHLEDCVQAASHCRLATENRERAVQHRHAKRVVRRYRQSPVDQQVAGHAVRAAQNCQERQAVQHCQRLHLKCWYLASYC